MALYLKVQIMKDICGLHYNALAFAVEYRQKNMTRCQVLTVNRRHSATFKNQCNQAFFLSSDA